MDKDHVSAFASGEPNTAYPQYFTGQSYLKMLTKGKIPVANVTFEPGCRNHWHIHHKGGQILLCVGGVGYYQEWGQPARRLVPGDVVEIDPDVKQSPAGAHDSWYTHIARQVPADGSSNEWCEEVSDEEYKKAVK